jgi:quercetin dioxygenase-like cupin family protein
VALDHIRDAGVLRIWDDVHARTVEGENVAFAVVELDPGANVPEHQHVHEQLGIVLRGSVRFRVGDEVQELGPGGTWRIGSDVPHEVTAGPHGAEVIDVFAPARDDWASLERQAPREPRWPSA